MPQLKRGSCCSSPANCCQMQNVGKGCQSCFVEISKKIPILMGCLPSFKCSQSIHFIKKDKTNFSRSNQRHLQATNLQLTGYNWEMRMETPGTRKFSCFLCRYQKGKNTKNEADPQEGGGSSSQGRSCPAVKGNLSEGQE